MKDAFISRIKRKARSNQLAIVTGSRLLQRETFEGLVNRISERFALSFSVKDDFELSSRWNEFVTLAEKSAEREQLKAVTKEILQPFDIRPAHRRVAAIPISNFIDISLDHVLTKALREASKTPILHNFMSSRMGGWKQSSPTHPNVFYIFADLDSKHPWHSLHAQVGLNQQDRIQIENMMEMVRHKDLLLLDVSPGEAEHILHLAGLAQAADKVVVNADPQKDYWYWARRGVYVSELSSEEIIDELLPHDQKSYTFWDAPFPRSMIVDIGKKDYDCFINYHSGDQDFAKRIATDLANRDLNCWIDQQEIDIGDSISDRIQEGLKKCYTFVSILSPESLARPWVREELRAAYNLRLADDLKILPVIFRQCEIPPFLMDYRYADFREEKNYPEQIELLARAVSNAVRKAREKL